MAFTKKTVSFEFEFNVLHLLLPRAGFIHIWCEQASPNRFFCVSYCVLYTSVPPEIHRMEILSHDPEGT